jgi:hypothetical protein
MITQKPFILYRLVNSGSTGSEVIEFPVEAEPGTVFDEAVGRSTAESAKTAAPAAASDTPHR